jgi:hypothetical protein
LFKDHSLFMLNRNIQKHDPHFDSCYCDYTIRVKQRCLYFIPHSTWYIYCGCQWFDYIYNHSRRHFCRPLYLPVSVRSPYLNHLLIFSSFEYNNNTFILHSFFFTFTFGKAFCPMSISDKRVASISYEIHSLVYKYRNLVFLMMGENQNPISQLQTCCCVQ